jgi:hypothetical protein
MNARVKAIADQAQALTPAEQAELVDVVLHQMHGGMDPTLMAEWIEEIDARSDALDRGTVKLVSAEVAFAKYVK